MHVPGIRPCIRPREEQPAQQKVDAANVSGSLLDHCLILKLRRFPLSLHFEGLSVQLMSGEGLRSIAAKILRSSCRQVGIGMDYDKKYVRVLAEIAYAESG